VGYCFYSSKNQLPSPQFERKFRAHLRLHDIAALPHTACCSQRICFDRSSVFELAARKHPNFLSVQNSYLYHSKHQLHGICSYLCRVILEPCSLCVLDDPCLVDTPSDVTARHGSPPACAGVNAAGTDAINERLIGIEPFITFRGIYDALEPDRPLLKVKV
jgi:hypothetical protein